MLLHSRLQFVIENVRGAPLLYPFKLCGSSFGLGVQRHRYFEVNWPPGLQPPCAHRSQREFAQATNRTNKRCTVEVGVWRIPLDVQRRAMGIDWMDTCELSQAIPPAYTEWIGHRLLEAMRAAA
jgi:DNA (cytosine-5)-methyltransferase 1